MIIIKEFIRDLNLLSIFLDKNEREEILQYIKFSPFIRNKIWWNKQYQQILEKIFLSKIKIKYDNLYIPNNFDINYFIKINKTLPYYKTNKKYWINMMFFSEPNIEYFIKNWVHSFFYEYEKLIDINYLSHEDIVIWSDNMYNLVTKNLSESSINDSKINNIINNNVNLMLLSDYKDVLYWIRKNKYVVDIEQLNDRLYKIWKISWINKDSLMSLDYMYLMEQNIIKARKRIDNIKL